MDLISVIVPVYNVERYLNRCVKSILNQTYKNLEILLVDDGSPDRSPELCDMLSKEYSNIKVIHKINGGLSSARNAGIERCTGKYVSFIDSDDFIEKNFIKRLHDVIIKYNAEVAMLQYKEVNSDEDFSAIRAAEEIVYRDKDIEKAFLKLKIDSVCVGLYAADVVKKYRFLEGKTSEDIPFNFNVFRNIKTFVYVPEKRYYYFYNAESISNGVLDKNMLNYLYFRKEIYEYYKAQNNNLQRIAEALYARAAMGLQVRMTVYGISGELEEEQCGSLFNSIFKTHKRAFLMEESIPISRKVMGILIFKVYGIFKFLKGLKI